MNIAATDSDDAATETTFELVVNNVDPSVALSGAPSVDEGSTYTLTLGAITDPGTDAVSQYIVDWDDGNSDIYTTGGDKTHTYADGPTTPTITVDLKVTDAPPGHRGDTAQGGTKPATLITGHVVQVPLFVSEGDSVRIDTRTGDYLSRA